LGEKFGPDQKYVFVLAFKEDKNVGEVVQLILSKANHIIVTEFGNLSQDYPIHAADVKQIQKACTQQ
jgi:hypothetical protein